MRYPGSKAKIVAQILCQLGAHLEGGPLFVHHEADYREPFFGSGAIGMGVLPHLPAWTRIWINDLDAGLAAYWRCVQSHPGGLIDRIRKFTPTTATFYEMKAHDAENWAGMSDMDAGFGKLVLHQLSFSGLGGMAGGPIGGRDQRSTYNVGCRWNAVQQEADVLRYHRLFSAFVSLNVTGFDFEEMFRGATPFTIMYLDPPYVKQGPELYARNMSLDDHRRLATLLRATSARWLLSYDDHPEVRTLYDWADISVVKVRYTAAVARPWKDEDGIEHTERRKNHEILIAPRTEAVC